jgi:hypothetical protein
LLGDNISIKPEVMSLGEMIRKALNGNLAIGYSAHREMRGQRWYRLELAQSIIDKALSENRALSGNERGHVDQLFAEADEITPVIKKLWEQECAALMAPAA